MGPSGVQGDIHDSEKSRLRLEGNVEKLRKSLKQWQKWDAEYEDLREEISACKGSDEGDELVSLKLRDLMQLGMELTHLNSPGSEENLEETY